LVGGKLSLHGAIFRDSRIFPFKMV
jgi:hypothetical protein